MTKVYKMTQLGSEKEPDQVAVIIFKINLEQDPYTIIKNVKKPKKIRKKVYQIDNEEYHYISIDPTSNWESLKRILSEDNEYEYMFNTTFKQIEPKYK